MKTILTILFIAMSIGMQAQDFVREKDKKTDKVLLRGKITFADLKEESTMKWLQEGADNYEPNPEIVEQLKRMWGNYRFILFVGTWCSDTKDLLPKFYKVLRMADIPLDAIEMYGVDRDKQALNLEATFYNIQYVPTFIVNHQYREVGRVVETVKSSIEQDLLSIIEPDFMRLEMERAKKYGN